MKLKRILALAGVVLLVGLFITTLVLAIIGSKYFLASLYATIVVPVMIYVYILIYRVANRNEEKQND